MIEFDSNLFHDTQNFSLYIEMFHEKTNLPLRNPYLIPLRNRIFSYSRPRAKNDSRHLASILPIDGNAFSPLGSRSPRRRPQLAISQTILIVLEMDARIPGGQKNSN